MSRRLEEGVGLAAGVAAAGLILLRVSLLSDSAPLWGINAIFYLDAGPALIWTVAPLLLLLPFVVRGSVARQWAVTGKPGPAWAAGVLYLILLVVFLSSVATPLLGDGIDRLEATRAGWSSLAGQPAPLDLALHLLAFRIIALTYGETWAAAARSWSWVSTLAGGFAVAAVWKFAALSALNRGGRAFVFFITLAGGTLIFFSGYAENYVTLAAALYGYYLLFLLAASGRAPVWSLWAALAVLVGLHYFMALLLPAVVFALYRHRVWRPSRGFVAAAGVALAGFAAFVLIVIREHYGGLAAIFVSPAQWLSGYHLLGFLNQQLLACPAWPLLVPLAFTGKAAAAIPENPTDGVAVLRTFLGAAAVTLLVFFFFLRPVIGPAADWDLFAIPSLAYAPWLALRVMSRWGGRPNFVRIGWSAMVLTAAFTGPWLSANSKESSSLERYRDLLEWESGHNPWAASYGYLRLGKYLSRREYDPRNPEIVGSLRRAVSINPGSATLRLQVAKAFTEFGRPDLAAPEMAAHYRLQGQYYERQGRTREAMEQYFQWALAAPADPAANDAFGRACRQVAPSDPCRIDPKNPTLPRPAQ